jgi:predicted acetyltransferase
MLAPLRFVRPSLEHADAFRDWLDDWRGDPYDAYPGTFAVAWTDVAAYVALCKRMRSAAIPPIDVPLDAFWAFEGAQLVGELYLFYEPMDADNNIGYKVRPSQRRRGIATALTKYGIERLRGRGCTVARLTCNDENLASAAVIEGCGGRRGEDRLKPNGHVLRRYLIPIANEASANQGSANQGSANQGSANDG